MTIAQKCKAVRECLHISQAKLGQMIGTNQTEVSFMERGFIPEDVMKIVALEKIFGGVIDGRC